MRMPKRGEKGFTLVELLIILTILAMLAAIVTPALNGTFTRGSEVALKTDTRTIQSAVQAFYTDVHRGPSNNAWGEGRTGHYFPTDNGQPGSLTEASFPLPIGEKQTISQPYIVAEMTQALELNSESRVLEIGTGSGYQAAILAEIALRVYTVERIHSLFMNARKLFDTLHYHNILTKYSDGSSGWKEESPFDAIIVTAGAPEIPQALVEQLAVDGRMVVPVGNQYSQELIKIYKDDKGVHTASLGGCRFVKLVGTHGWKEE